MREIEAYDVIQIKRRYEEAPLTIGNGDDPGWDDLMTLRTPAEIAEAKRAVDTGWTGACGHGEFGRSQRISGFSDPRDARSSGPRDRDRSSGRPEADRQEDDVKMYRWEAEGPAKGSLHRDLDTAIMDALVYATWVAWFKGCSDEGQPTLMETGPDEEEWAPVATDDSRIVAFFIVAFFADEPDADELERQVVETLTSPLYELPRHCAEEALAQVEQYDGYRVQSLYRTGGATREEASFTEMAKAIGFNVIIFDENGPRRA